MDISAIVKIQRERFLSGATRPVEFRLSMLNALRRLIRERERDIEAALRADLNKTPFESYMTEIGMVLDELDYTVKHLASWAGDRRVRTPLAQFSSRSFVSPEPYGVVLIMSPWNYPFQLAVAPLIGAIAAGNCAVVKPSAYAANTSRVIRELAEALNPKDDTVAAVEGGRAENAALLDERFDYIFFTGSVEVGRLVMERASRNLTPVSLELGGKSPVIVEKSADIKLAAKRVAFGKYLNAGQTCVAPDYLLIDETLAEGFIDEFQKAVADFYPGGDFSGMPTIINDRHYGRIMGLVGGERVVLGGRGDPARRFIEPTLIYPARFDSPVMQEEIFGPVLPVIPYSSLDDALSYIVSRPKPLALYLFTGDSAVEKKVLGRCSFGGGCINDTIIHLATPYMPFGGVGESGMGSYHGKASFDTFTHYRSIVKKHTFIDLEPRYLPYSEKKLRFVKRFMG